MVIFDLMKQSYKTWNEISNQYLESRYQSSCFGYFIDVHLKRYRENFALKMIGNRVLKRAGTRVVHVELGLIPTSSADSNGND